MSKVYNKIVQSNTEPSKNDVWLKDGQMKTFGKEGWKPIGGGSSLDANTPIKESVDGTELIPIFDGENKMVNVSSLIKSGPSVVESLEDLEDLNLSVGEMGAVVANTSELSTFNDLYQLQDEDFLENYGYRTDNLTKIRSIHFNLNQNINTGNYIDFAFADKETCDGMTIGTLIAFNITEDNITIALMVRDNSMTILKNTILYDGKIRFLTTDVQDIINAELEKNTFYFISENLLDSTMLSYLNKIASVYTGVKDNSLYIKDWEGVKKVATNKDIDVIFNILNNKETPLRITKYDIAEEGTVHIRDGEYAIITCSRESTEEYPVVCNAAITYDNNIRPVRTKHKALITNIPYLYVNEYDNNKVLWPNGEIVENLDPNTYYILEAELINIDGTTDGIICFVTVTPFKSV